MYGRTGELNKLYADKNNTALSKFNRNRADKALSIIIKQMSDKKLMRLRLQLINASKAGDETYMIKIQQQMRDYLREDKETGL